MKLHEYQAKEILKKFNIPIQNQLIIEEENKIESEVKRFSQELGITSFVVKAQIHAGGRGKGGGVKVASSVDETIKYAKEILGMNLVTHQTGPEGQLVRKIMITETADIAKEYYLAVTLDRAKGKNVMMASTEGGVEIEEVAAKTPDKIIKVWIDPAHGMQAFQARQIAFGLGLSKDQIKQAIPMFLNLYKAYEKTDASIAEINPLVVTGEGDVLALDAKFVIDDNGLYRQKEIDLMRDEFEEDPTEVEASKYNLNYIKLDGNVGCMVNGAGLAMSTMDIIKLQGGEPANFLDVGGTANVETVKNGFKIILSDDSVKAVLINIFGGIVRCDRIADGIIEAVKDLHLNVPVVVRLEGTNADIAKKTLDSSGIDIISAGSLKDAAEKVVAAATK